jgi:hypothetical protein
MSLTVKIDTRSKAAKKLVDYLETLSFVKIDDAPHYDPAFVKKIQMAEEEIENGNYRVHGTKTS